VRHEADGYSEDTGKHVLQANDCVGASGTRSRQGSRRWASAFVSWAGFLRRRVQMRRLWPGRTPQDLTPPLLLATAR
jgi:hypothetical protein